MGIYDREYVRVGPRSSSGLGNVRPVSVNTWLIIINVAIFVVMAFMPRNVPLPAGQAVFIPGVPQEILERSVVAEKIPAQLGGVSGAAIVAPDGKTVVGVKRVVAVTPIEYWGHFSTQKGFFGLEVWRFVSFQFLHAGIDHIVFNMLGLWFVGGLVEEYLGRKRYLAFYLTCGIFGALMYLLLNLLGTYVFRTHAIPGLLFDDAWTPLVGASAGIFGVLMAAAFIAPRAIVQVMFIIPMRLRTAVYLFTGIALANLLFGSKNAGGEAAHMGGAIAGFYFIRHMHLLRDFFDVFGDSRGPKERPPTGGSSPAPAGEVDRILAKIKAQGLHSLTEAEKASLREASQAGQGR